jgi:Cu/Ag efflux protein CusF
MALLCLSACHRTQSTGPGKRYHFTGRIISLDPRSESAFIYGDEIPGFMDSMGMSYKIKPAATLDKLTPGDVISAEVVVQPNSKDESAESDYWLENVKVTGHVKPTAKPTMWRGSCGADRVARTLLSASRFRNERMRHRGSADLRGRLNMKVEKTHVGTAAPGCPAEQSSACS